MLVKALAARQDNDKNQIYVGGDLTQLAKIPTGAVEASATVSRKTRATGKTKFTVPVPFTWITPEGDSPAPKAKMIYYPQYPEVRLSGLMQGSASPPRSLYSRTMRGQEAGRTLLLGINRSTHEVWALLLPPESLAKDTIGSWVGDSYGVFRVWDLVAGSVTDSASALVTTLQDIHALGWVPSQRIKDGVVIPYRARNGGGYTLESLLGVAPNGYSEPDFLGWEIKAHGVRSLASPARRQPLTLMTPEPTGGVYRDHGVPAFMQRYGRQNTSTEDRWDFTGRHFVGRAVPSSGTMLKLHGWAPPRDIEPDGRLALVGRDDEVAASWTFTGLMEHWKRKHAQACYVPFEVRDVGDRREYRFGGSVLMCRETSLSRFFGGFHDGLIYYDPGINMRRKEGRWVTKRRSQFRAAYEDLPRLYERFDEVLLGS